VRGKGTKLGDACPKVRLSKDRMPVEPLPLPDGRERREGGSHLSGGS